MIPVRIVSMARRLPARRVANREAPFPAHDDIDALEKFWGIERRGVIDEPGGECEITLAEDAAREALDLAGVGPAEIGYCFASITSPVVNPGPAAGPPSRFAPRVAWHLARRLGLGGAVAADCEVECMSFLVQVQMAANLIEQGRASHVLVAATERMSAILDYDKRSAMPFGDGAVVAVIGRAASPEEGLLGSLYFSDPAHYELATVRWDGPQGAERPVFTMAEGGDRALAELVPSAIPRVVSRFLEERAETIADYDSVILHQPSQFILDAWIRRLKIPRDRTVCNVRDNGCLVSASLPLALYDGLARGVVRPGHATLLGGLGAGWAFGAQAWRMGEVAIPAGDRSPPA